MVLVGGAIYEVGDPVHPKLLCTIRNTIAHLNTGDTFTYARASGGGFDVVLRSMGSGNESVIASFPLTLTQSWGGYAAWTADGTFGAGVTQDNDSAGDPQIHVWLASQRSSAELYSFPQPLTDCICRFGLPPPILAFSPDGQYLVSGWPIGKGATPAAVYRVADRTRVFTLPVSAVMAWWEPTGHRLLMSGASGQEWAPEGGLILVSSNPWTYEPSNSPDGLLVAYTAYKDPSVPTSLRVYVYNPSTNQSRLLIDKLRSEVLFAKDGWVWFHEEGICDPQQPGCSPSGTAPTGRDIAMDLSTGVEMPVVFAAGESPEALQSGWEWGFGSGPAEHWPNS